MAFRSPATARRHLTLQSIPAHDDDQRRLDSPSLLGSPAISHTPTIEADADEWVVFSPSSVGGATAAVTGTHALSQASDLLSVGSACSPRVIRRGFSGGFTDLEDEVEFEEEEEEEDEEDEEDESYDTETDSLRPFRDLGNEGPVMLPMHDGLGTFPSSSGVVSGLRSLEESLRIVAEAAGGESTSDDINARIQKWREEQGQALLDEIQRASRRRTSLFSGSIRGGDLKDEDEASMNIEGLETEVEEAEKCTSTSTPTQSNSGASTAAAHGGAHEETLWRRITRRFIRDIMGIDDDLLQVIFGEALPEEATASFLAEGGRLGSEAEERMLNRIARELGVMVNQYTPHPASDGRAFSTIAGKVKSRDGLSGDNDDGVKTPQPPPPPPAQQYQQEEPTSIPQPRPRSQSTASTSSIPHYQFAPTLPPLQQSPHHPTLWNIEESLQEEKAAKAEAAKRKEYWEQELGVRVFFSFLKSRFSSSSPSAPTSTPSTESAAGITHPLIPRARVVYPRRRLVGGGVGGGLRSGSTCASQSGTKAKTGKRSRNGGAGGGGAGGSRSRGGFYWDVPRSVGSGTSSCVGTGVWGPV